MSGNAFMSILFLLLLTLKLTDLASISWFVVFLPFTIPLTVLIFFLCLIGIGQVIKRSEEM